MCNDPYAILGATKYSTTAFIKQRYKELVLRHHPDSSIEPDVEKFMNVQFAYDELMQKTTDEDKVLSLKLTLRLSEKELAETLGETIKIQYNAAQFEIKVPYHTRMNDTITVKSIAENVNLSVIFKDTNE
jgi:DnaJ-class molecular chaperone